jgi:hypothetical protein
VFDAQFDVEAEPSGVATAKTDSDSDSDPVLEKFRKNNPKNSEFYLTFDVVFATDGFERFRLERKKNC